MFKRVEGDYVPLAQADISLMPTPPETRIATLEAQTADYDGIIIDQAYRITLLELGVM